MATDDPGDGLADQLAEARAEGERAALGRVGAALVEAEFRAALRGRHLNPEAVTEHLDHAKFVTEDGHVDSAHVQAYADLVCRPGEQARDAEAYQMLAGGMGKRPLPAAPPTMTDLIREKAGFQTWRSSGPRYS